MWLKAPGKASKWTVGFCFLIGRLFVMINQSPSFGWLPDGHLVYLRESPASDRCLWFRVISMITNSSPSPSEPALIAKSSILLDVKPWDDETDMSKLEECVRSIQMDGLVWGQCKNTTCSTTYNTVVPDQYWSIINDRIDLCRLDDDLTHHLSAEHEMKLSDLKTAENQPHIYSPDIDYFNIRFSFYTH